MKPYEKHEKTCEASLQVVTSECKRETQLCLNSDDLGERKGVADRTDRPLFMTKPLFWLCSRTEKPLLCRKALKTQWMEGSNGLTVRKQEGNYKNHKIRS
jgi:hypothetical protein